MPCNNNTNSLVRHMLRFVGEPVIIFTTSGGPSGCGFSGVLLSVNNRFVRLLTNMGDSPTHPLSQNGCPSMTNGCMTTPAFSSFGMSDTDPLLNKNHMHQTTRLGSVCDIPVDRIAAFCHNTV